MTTLLPLGTSRFKSRLLDLGFTGPTLITALAVIDWHRMCILHLMPIERDEATLEDLAAATSALNSVILTKADGR